MVMSFLPAVTLASLHLKVMSLSPTVTVIVFLSESTSFTLPLPSSARATPTTSIRKRPARPRNILRSMGQHLEAAWEGRVIPATRRDNFQHIGLANTATGAAAVNVDGKGSKAIQQGQDSQQKTRVGRLFNRLSWAGQTAASSIHKSRTTGQAHAAGPRRVLLIHRVGNVGIV